MMERPILVSGLRIMAILEGRTTQMRLVVKPQPDSSRWKTWVEPIGVDYLRYDEDGNVWNTHAIVHRYGKPNDLPLVGYKCPYGQVGDRLWVRETHAVLSAGYIDGTGMDIRYRATDPDYPYGWTPSIHMPRWASRITLEITGIRIERVQEITFDDIIAEGFDIGNSEPFTDRTVGEDARDWYRNLWDSINGKKHPWKSNPWVWVVEFKRVNPQEGK